jgi:hypothetical protein
LRKAGKNVLIRHQIVDILGGARRKSKLPHALVVAEAESEEESWKRQRGL